MLNSTVSCPYCFEEQYITIDAENFKDEGMYSIECEKCSKTYRVRMFSTLHTDFEGVKSPCSNKEGCEFSGIKSYGFHTTRFCSECGKDEHPLSEYLKEHPEHK